jgi:RNA polymerase sigma factor (sigma-70 family)
LAISIANGLLLRVLRQHARREISRRGGSRQDVEDLTQEAFIALWKNDAQELKKWDPTRDPSFVRFAGFVAKRKMTKYLHRQRTRQSYLVQTGVFEHHVPVACARSPEEVVIVRLFLEKLLVRLFDGLEPKSLELFQLSILEERSAAGACHELGCAPNVVHKRLSRLRNTMRAVALEIEGRETASSKPSKK